VSTKHRRPDDPGTAARFSLAAETIVRPAPAGVLLRAEVARILARVDTAEAIRRRAVQEALSAATAHTWRRRAALLRWALSVPGEYLGQATLEQIAERDARLAAQARACENQATLLELGLLDEAVSDVR
jgi:hypothetical protein